MIRPHAHLVGLKPSFTIYDTDDSKKILHNCIEDVGLTSEYMKPGAAQARDFGRQEPSRRTV